LADQENKIAADVDLDEDLFNFDEVMPDEGGDVDDEIDLDEIFAAFQENEESAPEEGEEIELDDLLETPAAAIPQAASTAVDDGDLEDEIAREFEDDGAEKPSGVAAAGPVSEPAAGRAPAVVAAPVRRRRRAGDRRKRRQRDESPRPAPAGLAPRAVTFLTKGAVVVLLAMTLLNVSIALVTFSSASGMRADLEAASREMSEAALEIRDRVDEQADAVKQQFSPVVAPTLDDNPTFDRAEAEIQVGEYGQARRRIYALLAVIDRQPSSLREELEARASFLLARSYHLEAVAAGEGR